MRYQEVPLEEIFAETDQSEGDFGEFDWEDQEYESWEQEGPPAGVSRNSPEYFRWIQSSLNKIIGLNLAVDGKMGPQTRSAIRSFQMKQGLTPDGIVGPQTEAALKKALGEGLTTPPLLCPPFEQTIQRTVYGWGQYRRQVKELPPDQQAVLTELGNTIISSFKPGCQPVRTAQIYGHADYDTPHNLQREQQYSEERAKAVTNWLKTYVGDAIAAQITWDTKGFGATQLKALPTTEENRRQNRRVEVYIFRIPPVPFFTCECPPANEPERTAWLQKVLNMVLGLRLPVDGIMGAQTRSALRSFQTRQSLPASGTPDRATISVLVKAQTESGQCKAAGPCDSLPTTQRPPKLIGRASFTEMWERILSFDYFGLPSRCSNRPNLAHIFTPELLIGIFWEETRFQNKRQITRNGGIGRAVGFGQVESQEVAKACSYCQVKPVWTPDEILASDEKGVQITGMLLRYLYSRSTDPAPQNRKLFALRGYVGWFNKPNDFKGTLQEWQQKRACIYNGWLKCEEYLNSQPKDNPIQRQTVIAALNFAVAGKPDQRYNDLIDGLIVFRDPLPKLKYQLPLEY